MEISWLHRAVTLDNKQMEAKRNQTRPTQPSSSRVRSASGFPSVATAPVELVVIGSASELLHYCRGFKNCDWHTLSPGGGLSRPTSSLELDPAVRKAFDVAYANIYAFHDAQRVPEKDIENMTGVRCKRIARCIGAVGLYVPGGTAVLPSTALMLSVPTHIAGCKTIVLATPPSRDGSICKVAFYKNLGPTLR
ncbi:histidinol dehydrogenase, chloroplastic-like isoform X3 [Musa acuminata AAA Group]|uniref:histidinol dehydrogenase, chloroplastic-like isoform X3 n=1 Tax=Musa acuminata AAA Group TaxID=214697 RepID=UPI0031D8541C